ncbi:unnamed protein product [Blepharisma stoltei]|uniref:Uncharacterized protein n=1 Tax=Blepharisma stoltei TaxID=1481888 RepID=A0AAU9JKK5_9CILI|nr:unnamed protein product [Blepharisma stoltei]
MKFAAEKETLETISIPSVFTNMPSLLVPQVNDQVWPICLSLPCIFSNETLQPVHLEPGETQEPSSINVPDEQKPTRIVPICTHYDKKHYAKNMCNNCYHRFGRDKLAWNCPHKDRQHYAKGKCQLCYLQNYHRSKVFGKRRKRRNTKPQGETQIKQ